MSKLKAYIIEDSLFCYVDVVLANNRAQAIAYYNKNNGYNSKITPLDSSSTAYRGTTIRSVPLKEGFLVDGGGNG